MAITIKGTGSALPANICTNNDIAKAVDTSDEWIVERTGIKERHVATGETVASLATDAAIKAIKEAGVNAESIELILVASCSAEYALPCVACQVQSEIGAVNAVAYDLNAACSGFLFALNNTYAYFKSGIYKNALIIGAEVLSNIVDWKDRGTCILFGDGAGAVYVENDDRDLPFYFYQRSDGTKGNVLACRNRDSKNICYDGTVSLEDNISCDESGNGCLKSSGGYKYVTMDGREVFKFATRQVPLAIEETLKLAGVTANEVDMFILHQANVRIIEGIAKRLNADINKFPSNVSKVGNTSSASIPILLDEVRKSGKLDGVKKLVLSGFGAGLTYGACLIEL